MKQLYTYFEASCNAYPGHAALVFDEEPYTYSQLREKAHAVKKYIDSGEAEHTVIAVFAPKTITTYASILGILDSGNAYCPLNPKFPMSRNASILRLSRAPLLIGRKDDEAYLGFVEFIENETALPISSEEKGDYLFVTLNQAPSAPLINKAYLLFTSGTTGQPKGVLISHEQAAAYVGNIIPVLNIAPGERCSHTFDLTFDLSVHDLFVTWACGAALCVPNETDLLSPAAYVKRQGVRIWFSVPSLAELMRKVRQLKENNLQLLRTMLFCGEALPYSLVAECAKAAPGADIINLYGPTEATIAISVFKPDLSKPKQGIVEIGAVLKGNQYRIAEGDELLLNGSQVISSYYTEGNTDKFVMLDNKIWYRTGDRVGEENGVLQYRGRIDEQVKLNGYRIELVEIEQAASQYLGGKNVACIPLRQGELVKQLAMAVEGKPDEVVAQGLRAYLKIKLPAYMVPETIRFVEKFPLNSNGKTDKKAILGLINE